MRQDPSAGHRKGASGCHIQSVDCISDPHGGSLSSGGSCLMRNQLKSPTIMAVMIMANLSMSALTFWLLATKNFVIIASKNGRNNTIPKIVIIRKM